ncbi:MAG: PEGA domain-containing protein, partial [Myxococcales bacterium]|nr:PEGA domain-containing protein [Myxococcales bacterium]
KKPARLKGADKPPEEAKAEAPAKKKGKQASDTPKVPVGRKQLRPGLTQIQRVGTGGGLRTWLIGGVVTTLALAAGAAVGMYRGKQVSRQTTFRQMEVANREGGGLATVTVFISSEPPGATVRFDSRELSEKTPLAVERDRDAEAHQVQLSMPGYASTERSVKYDSGPITVLEAKLEGDPGRLEVSSQPSEQPVFIDGQRVGETPLIREVPHGKHLLEVGGGDRAKVHEEITVQVGEKTKVYKKVPKADAMAQLLIDSEPKARILINGQPTGRFTGDGALDLPPGVDHDVRLEYGGSNKRQRALQVNLERGEHRRIFVDLTSS